MTSPKRRSSRVRNQTPQKDDSILIKANILPAIKEYVERSNNSVHPGAQKDTPAKPTFYPTAMLTPSRSASAQRPSQLQTPTARAAVKPSPENMHSKHYQSAEKEIGSGVRAGNFVTKIPASSPIKPSHGASSASLQSHQPVPFSSSAFEFRCKRASTDMSEEAQKMMDELRDQATKIKVCLEAQRNDRATEDGKLPAAERISGRKFAVPKGKASRFSDVHVAQFKKMDSIANHPSRFRADPSRLVPSTKSLKRTRSKADLGENESTNAIQTTRSSQSSGPEGAAKRFKAVSRTSPSPEVITSTECPILCPVMEDRQPTDTKTSASASALDANPNSKSIEASPHARSKLPTPITPSKLVSTLAIAKTDVGANNKFRNPFAATLSEVKSILRKPQLRYSNDPVKLAAGTHVLPGDQDRANAQKAQATPSKRVVFSSSVSEQASRSANATSPSSNKNSNDGDMQDVAGPVTYPSLHLNNTQPSIIAVPDKSSQSSPTPRHSQPTERTISDSPAPSKPQNPQDFTFRCPASGTYGISFADPPSSVSENQVFQETSRPLRSSDVSLLVPKHSAIRARPIRRSVATQPTGLVAADLSDRKRKRETGDDGSDGTIHANSDNKENSNLTEETGDGAEYGGNPVSKKVRLTEGSSKMPRHIIPSQHKRTPSSAKHPKSAVSVPSSRARLGKPSGVAAPTKAVASSGTGRSVLSLSRLNALAKPKERK